MKSKISVWIRYILVITLPVVVTLIAFQFYDLPFLDQSIGRIVLWAGVTAGLANFIWPIGTDWRKSFGVTFPTILLFLALFSMGPLFQVQIYEPEDYVIYFWLCGGIPFIGLLFWCGIAFSTRVGTQLGILARKRATVSALGQNKSLWGFTFALVCTAFLFWLVSLAAARAQSESLLSDGWETSSLPKTGFVSGEIRFIRLDRQGDPWVASTTGVYHKAGPGWERYLESMLFLPLGMEVDQTDRLFVSTNTGLYVIDQNKPQIYDDFTSASIVSQQGMVWYRCIGSRYCDVTGKQKLDLKGRKLLTFDPSGRMWAYRDISDVISVYENGQWKDISIAEDFIPDGDLPHAFDSQGRLWLAGYGKEDMCCRLAHLEGGQWLFEDVPFVTKRGHWAWITGLAFDAQGRLWVSAVGTDTGLAVKDSGAWTFYQASRFTDLGQENGVRALFLDQQNRLWFGVDSTLVNIKAENELPVIESKIDTIIGVKRWSRNIMFFFVFGAIVFGMITLYKSLSSPLKEN